MPAQTPDKPPKQERRAIVVQSDPYDGSFGSVLKAADDFATRQILDPFHGIYGAPGASGNLDIIAPTFSPYELMRLPLANNVLDQCIDAMVVNIAGFGHSLEFTGKPEQKESKPAQDEKIRIEDFLRHPNPQESMVNIRRKTRRDRETLGYGFWEIGRDSKGDVGFVYHLPGYSVRRTVVDAEKTAVKIKLKRGPTWQTFTIKKQFCRFVQMVGVKRIYFKEFGDPRAIDPETGKVNNALPIELQATEVIMFTRYVTGEFYGVPRWINNLPAILGSRESEITNLQFFKDNAIPALAVLVAGGMLTETSVQAINTAFTARGLASINRVLVLEAQSSSDNVGTDGAMAIPRIELKPLQAERQNDALFQKYDENNRMKIRSSFRLPPLFTGESSDYTRATAESSMDSAESQVFSPERMEEDEVINNMVLAAGGVPPQFWAFNSNPAKIVGGDTIMEAVATLNEAGGMTPNIAIRMCNELFGTEIALRDEPWADLPWPVVQVLMTTGKMDLEGNEITPPQPVLPEPGAPGPGKPGAGGPAAPTVAAQPKTPPPAGAKAPASPAAKPQPKPAAKGAIASIVPIHARSRPRP